MDLFASRRGNEGSGAGGGVSLMPPEYYHKVYLHSSYTVAMSGGGETAGGAGVEEMVGSVLPIPIEDRDGYGDVDRVVE